MRIMRERDDLAFLNDEDMWPHWPCCCLKKPSVGNELIVATLISEGPEAYQLVKDFRLFKDKTVFDENKEKWGEPDQIFTSAQEVLDAGWIVD